MYKSIAKVFIYNDFDDKQYKVFNVIVFTYNCLFLHINQYLPGMVF